MTPGDWERVDRIFQRAVEMPQEERGPFVRREASGDGVLEREVLSLLSYDQHSEAGIGRAVRSLASRVVEETEIGGQRIGIYRVVRKIGEGGMGSVYLGVRDDGEFRKEVAIKMVRPGMETPQFVERFRSERQILANLDHPYVARLLDGGAAQLPGRPGPIPFLVMDYVSGDAIHSYCRRQQLSIADRCRLFAKVCEAVAHAHGQLIVHRDIKPGNILVGADGNPKLLDFGIAQLIAQPEGPEAGAKRRALTIDYASPEQVRGEMTGIGADVYSLGAVFYELLTGVRPHRFRSYSAPEVEKVICQDPLVPPSAADIPEAPGLRGDLDAIVARAMRKDAAERYGSVDALRQDIERYLADLPVEARAGSAGYRARKFVRRHRWAVMGGAVAAIGLAVGTAGALWQAHRAVEAQAMETAQRQRAEREAGLAETRRQAAERAQAEADAERAEAVRRLRQVRELANRLLFEYQTEVAALPGSTAVRKKMVETGLAYFDSLAGEKEVRREMVDGLRRLGDIQGNPYYSNLGDVSRSLASYERALGLAASMGEAGRRARAELLVARGDVLTAEGDFAKAEADYRAAAGLAGGDRALLATVWEHRGDLEERRGQISTALPAFERSIGFGGGAEVYQKAGSVLSRMGRPRESFAYLQKSLALTDAALERNSIDPRDLRTQVWVLIGLSDLYRNLTSRRVLNGTLADSWNYIERGLRAQERLRTMEPFNPQYVRDWTLLEQRATSTALYQERFDVALQHGLQGVRAAEELGRLSPGQTQPELILATALVRVAKPLSHLKRFAEAEAAYARAETVLNAAEKRNAEEGVIARERYYLARDRYVLVYEEATAAKPLVELKAAVGPLQEAIRLNAALLAREPNAALIRSDRAELQSDLAALLADTGDVAGACRAYAAAYRFRKEDDRPLRASEEESFRVLEAKLPNCRKD